MEKLFPIITGFGFFKFPSGQSLLQRSVSDDIRDYLIGEGDPHWTPRACSTPHSIDAPPTLPPPVNAMAYWLGDLRGLE
jgi:hypothetical protein